MATIDYRFPQTREHRILEVMGALSQEDVIGLFITAGKIGMGIPLCLALPALIWYWTFLHNPKQATLSLICSLIIVLPLLFWWERHRRRQVLWDIIDLVGETEDHDPETRPGAPTLRVEDLFDLLLFGPRLILSVVDQLRSRQPIDQSTRRVAATIVVVLLDRHGFTRVGRIVSREFTLAEITQATTYLRHRGWLIYSRKLDGVMLRGSVRRQLSHINKEPARPGDEG